MSTATVHGGRHTRQALQKHREPAKPERRRLKALRSLLWASKQTAASSLLAAPVDVAEEAQEQQRGGEPGPAEGGKRLADTGEMAAVAAIVYRVPIDPEPVLQPSTVEQWATPFDGHSGLGQLEQWGPFPPASQPVTAAEAIGDDKPAYAADTVADLGCAAGRTGAPRPFAPESAEAGADSFAFLRMFGEDGNPVGEADELFRGPVLTGLGYAGEERLAEVSLGMCEGGGYAVAGNSAYLRASAAAMLAGADALDREAEFDAAWEQDAAAEPDSEDETVPEPAAEVLADTGTETEMAGQSEMAAVSGSEGGQA